MPTLLGMFAYFCLLGGCLLGSVPTGGVYLLLPTKGCAYWRKDVPTGGVPTRGVPMRGCLMKTSPISDI